MRRSRKLRTFKEAQADLAAFDAVHWSHGPGVDTLRHVLLHLMETLVRESAKKEGLEEVGDETSYWYGEMPGRFIEHALRLANSYKFDLDPIVTRLASGQKILLDPSGLGWFANCFSRSLGSLHAFIQLCERLDHTTSQDSEMRDEVIRITEELVVSSLRLMKLDHVFRDKYSIYGHLLELFDRRLVQLSQRFEYVAVKQ
ncbi:MAG: hypothetical protein Q7R79_00455 [bacterium]|nr:hypothetical protein [bacterium]